MNDYQQPEPMSLGWLDNNKAEQNKIKYLISLLQEKGALDELGIGTIRDAFSNLLFPGITTAQTRAKYLVLLLYLFQEANGAAKTNAKEANKSNQYVKKINLLQLIDELQNEIVDTFRKKAEKGIKETGVIGIRTRDVDHKPASIYWGALRTFNMVNPNLSINDMCNLIWDNAVKAEQKRNPSSKKKKDDDDYYEDAPDAFLDSPVLFSPITWDNSDWRDELSMTLTYDEAEFICNKILTSPWSQNSALAQLLCYYRDKKKTFRSLNLDEIPNEALDDNMRNILHLAKEFRDFIFGAYLAYNYLLSNRTDVFIKEVFDEWKQRDFNNVPLKDILKVTKANCGQTGFLENLLNHAKAGKWDDFHNCVENRESDLKRNRKKIGTYDPEKNPYKSPYKSPEEVYAMLLDFRANKAGRILKDIIKGLI